MAPGCAFDPVVRAYAGIENRRRRIILSQLALDSGPAPLAARDDEDMGTGQSGHGLAQTVGWKRIECIDEHDVHLAVQAPVLKTVVEDEVLHGKALGEPATDLGAIRSDSHRS